MRYDYNQYLIMNLNLFLFSNYQYLSLLLFKVIFLKSLLLKFSKNFRIINIQFLSYEKFHKLVRML